PDACSAPASNVAGPRLRVVATNDFHGRLQPERPSWSAGRPVGGAAALAAYFDCERSGFGGATILLDGGDVMQGTPISNLTEGRSAVDYYNAVGYAAAAIGNHELDWGVDVLRQRMAQAEFAWLAANLVVTGTDTTPSWVESVRLVTVEPGLDVGVIGLITEETRTATRPSTIAGLDFLAGAAVIDRWVPELRRQGAEFVAVVAHAGVDCDDSGCAGELIDWARTARERPDIIVGGHTSYRGSLSVNGIPVVQTGSYGTSYGVVDLARVAPDSTLSASRLVTPFADAITPDAAVAALVERYVAEIGSVVNRPVTTLAEPIPRSGLASAMGPLIADAMRAATGADIAIMNAGGVRAGLDAGPVTWSDLHLVQPFGNQLVVLRLTGAQLRETIEFVLAGDRPNAHVSGLHAVYDADRPPGQRLLTLTLADDRDIRNDADYDVVVNDFMAEGGDGFGMLQRTRSRSNTGVVDLDALVDYLESLPRPVRFRAEPRLRPITPAG
ncbi:MAG: bifunctional metallophosphatase/5'-nucleotidase, partial [Longimicrobiales bacterium]